MPLFLAVGDADGTGDDVMVAADVEALGREYCDQGVAVQFTRFQGLNHEEAALPFFPAAFEFLAQRMVGLPFTGNCASIGEGSSLDPVPTS
jgi:hypothetical protein